MLWPLPDRRHGRGLGRPPRPVGHQEDVLIGGSDAGAHLDRMLGSPYPTRFLADTLRGRRLVSIWSGPSSS